MPEWLIWLSGVLLFLVILSVTVALHEGGHMFAAKKLGLSVPDFSVGFGPKLFSRRGKKTEYSVRAIPLGGFVMIEDETQEKDSYERGALSYVAPWKRQIIFAAGPAVNLVLGTVLLMVALMAFPYQAGTNLVDKVQLCADGPCGSAEAGIVSGDRILSIDGIAVADLDEIAAAKEGKSSIDVLVERGGEEVTISNVKLESDTALMGIVVTLGEAYRTFPEAWTFVGTTVEQNIHALANLPSKVAPIAESIVTGERPEDAPGSVVSIGKNYGDTAVAPESETGNKFYIYMIYTALFSFGLGFLNMFIPLLPLDGGRMFIAFMDSCRLFWSKVTKKVYTPTRRTVYLALASVSAVVVFGFMGMLILSDFSLIFRGNL